MAAFKAGDKAYIVESNRIVRECTVKRVTGKLIIIRFENGGGIQVSENRLFDTKESVHFTAPSGRHSVFERPNNDFQRSNSTILNPSQWQGLKPA